MKEKVTFLGRIYTRDPDAKTMSHRRYFRRKRYDSRTKGYKVEYLHRVVWEHTNGKIPWDCVIHHKDGNHLNNALENLECIPACLHLRNCHSSRAPRKLPEMIVEVHISGSASP